MVEIEGVTYLTVDEVQKLLGVKPATIYAYVSRGILRSYKQGIKRQRLYRQDDVRALLELRPGVEEHQAVERLPEPRVEPAAPDDLLPDANRWIGEV